MRRASCVCLVWLLTASVAPEQVQAGPFPEWWEHLPQISTLVFSETSLGLVAQDGRRFVLDRASLHLEAIDADAFARSWPEALPAARQVPNPDYDFGTFVLRTTNGAKEKK